MISKGLDKAKLRLRVAERSVADLEECQNYDDFSEKWYMFLHATKGIYTTLEQCAKITPQSRQWFGAKNAERRNDPLLRYVTEARNDDEHGIEVSTEAVPASLALGVKQNGFSGEMMDEHGNVFSGAMVHTYYTGYIPDMIPRLQSLDGKPVLNIKKDAHIKLVPVHDRSNNSYNPPNVHLQVPVLDQSPLNIARLTVAYLSELLDEAEGFRMP